MMRSIKPLICPSRSSSKGFALLIVMVAAAVLLIGLTAVLPSVYQEGQREREAELIFRGYQYARAIAGYHQKFQRYPTSIQDLTKLTNGFRFLRKEYADPMTPGGKWRFIHANAQGVLLDSKTQGPPPGAMGQAGANPGGAGFGASGASGTGGFGQQSMGSSGFGQQGSSFGQQSMGGSSFGQTNSGNSSFGGQGTGGSSFGPQSTGSSGFGTSSGGFSSNSNLGGSASGTQQNSGFAMGSSQGGGTFIVGVASSSHKQSIRIWNQKSHYDEWEFVGIDLGALGIATSIPGLPQGFQSGQGNQSGGFGQGNQPGGFGQGNQPGGFGQGNQPGGFGQGNQPGGFGQPNQSGNSSSGGSTTGGSDFSPQ